MKIPTFCFSAVTFAEAPQTSSYSNTPIKILNRKLGIEIFILQICISLQSTQRCNQFLFYKLTTLPL